MPDQTLFDNNTNPQETPAQPTPTSIFADQLKEIKDESGRQKYSTPEEALKALKHSQEYIPSLKGQLSQYEQEINQLKAELSSRASVEDIVSRLSPKPSQDNPAATPTPQGLDEKAVFELINRQLTQRQQDELRLTNLRLVESTLAAKFGDKAKEVLQNKAKELGISMERMKAMAEETPQVVQSLFPSTQTPTPKPVTGGYNLPSNPAGEVTLGDMLKEAEHKIRTSGQSGYKNQMELMAQIKRNVYAQNGIE